MNILQVKVSGQFIPRHIRGVSRKGNCHLKRSPISSVIDHKHQNEEYSKNARSNAFIVGPGKSKCANKLSLMDPQMLMAISSGESIGGLCSFSTFSARAIHTTSVASDDFSDHSGEEREEGDFEYNPKQTKKDILEAATWHEDSRKWDVQFCRRAVEAYKSHLQYLLQIKQNQLDTGSKSDREKSQQILQSGADILLKSYVTSQALSAMLKMKIPTHVLSKEVRSMERLIGSIGLTPLTDQLSFNLLRANGKSGNIGRVISLLNLRKAKGSEPKRAEFEYAIQSIDSAALYLRKNRNIFLNQGEQPEIDNPTRWLDAILVNMSERGFPLDTKMANRMLDSYSCQGRDGKAVHFFYRVTREFVNEGKGDEKDASGNENKETDGSSNSEGDASENDKQDLMPIVNDRKARVRMKMVRQMPPYYKMPSDIRSAGTKVKIPNRDDVKSKLEWENVRNNTG